MITSRTLSTPVWVAASISRTSMSRPSAISRHESHSAHGSAVGPRTQLRARASSLAVAGLPAPAAPAGRPRPPSGGGGRQPGRGRLAAAARAGEDERLGDALALEGVAKGL